MPTMKIASAREGDRRISWDKGKKHEVEDAKATFDNHVKQGGYLAYRVEDGKKGTQIRDFDPAAEEIILVPQMVGG